MSVRDRLFNDIWDQRSTAEKNALIDAHRDEVALEIGRDALRDGLLPTLTRLVGEANAAKLLADIRNAPVADEGRGKPTARDDLVDGLAEHACCYSREDATGMVDAFAHELAEQIRQESSDQWDRGNQDWDTHDAADLIDPVKAAT